MSAVDEVETIGVRARPETAATDEAADAAPAEARPLPARGAMLPSLFRLAFDLSLLPIAALVLVGRVGNKDWLFDMTNFFRPHIAVVALLFVLVAAFSASLPRISVAGLLLVAALYPLLVPSVPAAAAAPNPSLRVTTANVNGRNRDFESFRRVVEAAAPDILVIEEVTWPWDPTIASLPGLPYLSDPRLARRSSIRIASRYPVTAELVELEGLAKPTDDIGGSVALRAIVDIPGAKRPTVLYGIHPPTTRKAQGWVGRNAYLRALAYRIAAEPKGTNIIVAGDWNTPYWSPMVRNFMRVSSLVTTERGAWPEPTRFFREFGAPPFLGTPIDRIAVSKDIGVAAINVSKDFGSDHLAVTADLAIP